jgi:glycyl-tRNA synthetase beta chain
MSDTAMLVVEVVSEELPPKALKRLGEAFAEGIATGLKTRGYLAAASVVTPFATPRRLAVAVTQVRSVAPDEEVIDKLMPAKVAWDASGEPTEAYKKKLAGLGRPGLANASRDSWDGPDHVYVESEGKADYVKLRTLAKGQPLVRGLQDALDEAIGKLPIPKVMSYAGTGGYYNDVKFVRPARRLLALHGEDVVPVAALGLTADRVTTGHRFRSRDGIRVATAEAYEETLRAEGKVVASFAARRALIVEGLRGAAAGASVIMPEALLDEVTALVESPAVYEGTFDPGFLGVPQECLILTMQQNQKYFALAGSDGKLVPRFLVVSNLETEDPRAIVDGNERVLRARLADARFFFDQDRKVRLEARVPRLGAIVYHNKLGTQLDRVSRLERLSRELAAMIGADPRESERAAQLAKADLTTDMVGEFPELQGLMGRYYAEHDRESAAIAAAIEQHYWPRFAGDALPEGPVAQAVALADKLETLAGMFGIGAQPTGDRDPFGLRRHAIGAIRIVVEKALRATLPDLVGAAFRAFADVPAVQDAQAELENFIYERLRGYLREAGYSANQVEAVISQRPARIDLVPAQAAAVRAFGELPESQTLAAANKRIVNILRKSGDEAALAVDRGRLADGAEHDLYLVFQKLEPVVVDRCAAGDFAGALLALAGAKPAVDRFFDDVLVMAEDPAIRANRLALLRGVAQTMNRVADISKLAA